MNIVFMGTPDFAGESLKALYNEKYNISAVFTKPDMPVGRKHIMTPPEVKVIANELIIPVFQPSTLKDGEALKILKELNPDLIVVVAYGKILPKEILDLPKYGCINVHASLLPKYRGASPIQWAIVSGEKVTGVSTMYLNEGMDTGDILLTAKTEIYDNETAETLWDRLAKLGAELLLKTVKGLEENSITPIKQDEKKATYAPIIKKSDGLIDWSKSAFEINCKIRGLHNWPVAFTKLNGKILKVFSAEIVNKNG
ncbi:MAG: methionyl-tRNA formyltransferase, partial [Clostridia bacterium]|nr:methionyl-tRNA formyltransferase [Clostridia bacterium]